MIVRFVAQPHGASLCSARARACLLSRPSQARTLCPLACMQPSGSAALRPACGAFRPAPCPATAHAAQVRRTTGGLQACVRASRVPPAGRPAHHCQPAAPAAGWNATCGSTVSRLDANGSWVPLQGLAGTKVGRSAWPQRPAAAAVSSSSAHSCRHVRPLPPPHMPPRRPPLAVQVVAGASSSSSSAFVFNACNEGGSQLGWGEGVPWGMQAAAPPALAHASRWGQQAQPTLPFPRSTLRYLRCCAVYLVNDGQWALIAGSGLAARPAAAAAPLAGNGAAACVGTCATDEVAGPSAASRGLQQWGAGASLLSPASMPVG